MPILLILTLLVQFNSCFGNRSAAADDIPPTDHPKTMEPKIKEIHVEKVSALTGAGSPTDLKPLDVCGTDLGTMTEIGDRIFFAFGDTFGYDGDACRGVGGPNWRSNVFASTTDHNPADKVVLQEWLRGPDGKATAVVEGAHQAAFTGESGEQTKIPTAMIGIGDRIYLHYMSVHGFAAAGGVWDCNYSKFVYSDDLGRSWRQSDLPFADRDSNFNMLALTNEPGKGNEKSAYVYAVGTPCGRFGNARIARVRKENILDLDAWEYFSAGDRWKANPKDAVEIIPAPVGEGSILWNPGLHRWLYTYLNEKTTAIEMREAEFPWGVWSAPLVLARAAEYPQLYGAFLTPSFLKDNGRTLYFVMSMFGPYNTFIMKAHLRTD